MKNSNFKALVAKMEALKETEQGKLKGGISTLDVSNLKQKKGTNGFMYSKPNIYFPSNNSK